MIGVDRGDARFDLRQRIVEIKADILVERSLIAFEREGVIATLIDDLLGDGALAIERVAGAAPSVARVVSVLLSVISLLPFYPYSRSIRK